MRRLIALAALAGASALAVVLPAGAAPPPPPPDTTPTRPGAVYAATNDPTGNEIRVFARGADGRLTPAGDFATGGRGSGTFEQSANSVILGTRGGEASPISFTQSPRFLFTTNTGSDSVSVFRVLPDGLELVDVEEGGQLDRPISVTVSDGVVYALNSDRPQCASLQATITGFTLDQDGLLTPIPGSTRPLAGNGPPFSGCTQVSFNKTGDVLAVTEKNADVITTYRVGRDGLASQPIRNETPGVGPFGFTFTQTDRLLTTENNGQLEGQGAASSFRIEKDATLTPVSGNVRNTQTDTCWIVVTDNNKYAYVTNAMSNNISSYRVRPDGTMTLLEADAGRVDELPRPVAIAEDLALSGDSRFLYARNARDGDLFAFAVQPDGKLGEIQSLPAALPPGGAIGVAAR
jgi:6-phosphogluconolactonase (cycloisomerase 2 family)